VTRDGWIQGAGIVIAMALTGGAMITYSTWTLSQEIASAREESARQINVVRSAAEAQAATLASKQAADEQRLTAIENTERDHRADDLSARNQITAQLNAVINSVAQVQVEIARLAVPRK